MGLSSSSGGICAGTVTPGIKRQGRTSLLCCGGLALTVIMPHITSNSASKNIADLFMMLLLFANLPLLRNLPMSRASHFRSHHNKRGYDRSRVGQGHSAHFQLF